MNSNTNKPFNARIPKNYNYNRPNNPNNINTSYQNMGMNRSNFPHTREFNNSTATRPKSFDNKRVTPSNFESFPRPQAVYNQNNPRFPTQNNQRNLGQHYSNPLNYSSNENFPKSNKNKPINKNNMSIPNSAFQNDQNGQETNYSKNNTNITNLSGRYSQGGNFPVRHPPTFGAQNKPNRFPSINNPSFYNPPSNYTDNSNAQNFNPNLNSSGVRFPPKFAKNTNTNINRPDSNSGVLSQATLSLFKPITDNPVADNLNSLMEIENSIENWNNNIGNDSASKPRLSSFFNKSQEKPNQTQSQLRVQNNNSIKISSYFVKEDNNQQPQMNIHIYDEQDDQMNDAYYNNIQQENNNVANQQKFINRNAVTYVKNKANTMSISSLFNNTANTSSNNDNNNQPIKELSEDRINENINNDLYKSNFGRDRNIVYIPKGSVYNKQNTNKELGDNNERYSTGLNRKTSFSGSKKKYQEKNEEAYENENNNDNYKDEFKNVRKLKVVKRSEIENKPKETIKKTKGTGKIIKGTENIKQKQLNSKKENVKNERNERGYNNESLPDSKVIIKKDGSQLKQRKYPQHPKVQSQNGSQQNKEKIDSDAVQINTPTLAPKGKKTIPASLSKFIL